MPAANIQFVMPYDLALQGVSTVSSTWLVGPPVMRGMPLGLTRQQGLERCRTEAESVPLPVYKWHTSPAPLAASPKQPEAWPATLRTQHCGHTQVRRILHVCQPHKLWGRYAGRHGRAQSATLRHAAALCLLLAPCHPSQELLQGMLPHPQKRMGCFCWVLGAALLPHNTCNSSSPHLISWNSLLEVGHSQARPQTPATPPPLHAGHPRSLPAGRTPASAWPLCCSSWAAGWMPWRTLL